MPVPEALLLPCSKTPKPEGMTYRQGMALAEARGVDIDNCNSQLEAIRRAQQAP